MRWVEDDHGEVPADEVGAIVDDISAAGGTPLVVAERTPTGLGTRRSASST